MYSLHIRGDSKKEDNVGMTNRMLQKEKKTAECVWDLTLYTEKLYPGVD